MSDEQYQNHVEPPAEIVDPDQLIRVEDGLLVLPTGCVLPPICVVTNQPVSDRYMIKAELNWCSPWIFLVYVFLGPLFLLYFYFTAREQCTLTYGLSPRLYWRIILRRIFSALFAILLLVATVFLAAANFSAWLFVPSGILFVAALMLAVTSSSPLSVVKCRNSKYWIKGFRPDYLAQLPLEA